MTYVLKHRLRAGAAAAGSSYSPEGWTPRLKITLAGPSPAGAELVWTLSKPDGSAWFEHRIDAPELGEGDLTTVDLARHDDDASLDVAGDVAFTLRIVSELDGIDELLHEGSMTAVAREGEHRYAVDLDWLVPLGLVCLDSVDESDAPKLKVTVFLKGEVDSYQVEAHCFRNGTRFAQASYVSTGYTFSSNDGATIGQEMIAEFDGVRGWNNLRDQGWGSDWEFLDAVDGAYEVKFLREKKVTRSVPFTVTAGRLDAPGAIGADAWTGPVVITDATVTGDLDGEVGEAGAAFYGDVANAALWATIDDVYALCTAAPPSVEVEEVVDPAALDDEATEAMQRFFDRAERLINTWATDFETSSPPWELGDILQAEAVIGELPAFHELRTAAAAVPDAYAVELNGDATTIGAMFDRVVNLGALAEARVSGSADAEEGELAPYRALLAGDKLAVFEDHPAPDFLYYTTNKVVIETPEELAEAEFWFFEGTNETRGTGTADGVKVDVVVEGWRVLGWRFDGDGNTIDEFETQGQGSSAPKSAFTR